MLFRSVVVPECPSIVAAVFHGNRDGIRPVLGHGGRHVLAYEIRAIIIRDQTVGVAVARVGRPAGIPNAGVILTFIAATTTTAGIVTVRRSISSVGVVLHARGTTAFVFGATTIGYSGSNRALIGQACLRWTRNPATRTA